MRVFSLGFVIFPRLLPRVASNERILLVNLLQSSRSTLSRGSFLSFLAFKEGMLSTPISVLGGWPTVSEGFLRQHSSLTKPTQPEFIEDFGLLTARRARDITSPSSWRPARTGNAHGATLP